ncbi:MAG: adenylate/guanylate cyclase domain-containing protein [Alphaproteobacteria bacterium]
MTQHANIATRLRLASGLVLMAFVAGHLINHALVLHSLDAVEAGRSVFRGVWRSPPGTFLLYGALITHILLVLAKLYQRRQLGMPLWEVLQILLGLAIPFWLVVHLVGTRGAHEMFGVDDSYLLQFAWIWSGNAWQQTVMLLLVWLHGCIGLHFWLRIRPWYTPLRPYLLAGALLLPGLALAGFHLGGREVQAIAAHDPAWLERIAAEQRWPDDATRSWIYGWERRILGGFALLLAGIVLARMIRDLRERAAGRVQLRYLDGTTVSIEPGMSVLEGSRSAGIPHASVCGGRGRCSTCRVRVGEGAAHLPPPAEDELKVLKRIGATDGIRLACQLRPLHDLEVAPLLPAMAGPSASQSQVNPGAGVEREIAVLFADLRAFTRMAEGRLPFDVVFILNQYFKAMGAAIEGAGGHVDKFIGDGIMALFGTDSEPEIACRQALRAAQAMSIALDALNREIRADLAEPLRIGIGLHAGPVILGDMGYRQATSLTAIGDAVNVASRLEALTKEFNAQLVVSARLSRRADVDLSVYQSREIDIRGRKRPLRMHIVPDAASLPISGSDRGQPTMPKFSIARLLTDMKLT